jgi:uncharacterized protein (TIGR03067 family)
MRHAIGLALLTAGLTTPAWTQDKGTEDEKLFGTWILVLMERDKVKERKAGNEVVLTLAADGKITVKEKGRADQDGFFKLVTTGLPKGLKGMDMILKQDGKVRDVVRTLYQVDGDTLKVAMIGEGARRPTSFDPKQATIATYRRQKP